MKNYEVTLVAHYAKTVSIHADSPEQAAEKLKTVLFDTDLVKFSDGDFVCGEAEINDPMEEAGEECESEGEDQRRIRYVRLDIPKIQGKADCEAVKEIHTGNREEFI